VVDAGSIAGLVVRDGDAIQPECSEVEDPAAPARAAAIHAGSVLVDGAVEQAHGGARIVVDAVSIRIGIDPLVRLLAAEVARHRAVDQRHAATRATVVEDPTAARAVLVELVLSVLAEHLVADDRTPDERQGAGVEDSAARLPVVV